MEYWALHIFVVLGLITIGAYSYMAFVKRSPSFPSPSKVVVVGLAFLALVGALIPISQFTGEELTFAHYLKILYVALGLPGFAVGISIFRVLLTHGPDYFTKNWPCL